MTKNKKDQKQDSKIKSEPFIFEELPKSAVVNSSTYDKESEQDRIINEAVTEHLNNILDNQQQQQNPKNTDNDKNNEPAADPNSTSQESDQPGATSSNTQPQDPPLQKPKETTLNSEQKIPQPDESQQPNTPTQPTSTEAKSEDTIVTNLPSQDIQNKEDFAKILLEKLSSVTANVDLNQQISKFTATAISAIAKKLYLALPVDFEKIISYELIEKVKKCYKEGKITLTINPEKYDFCKEILQSDNIPAKLRESFEIVKDDNLGAGDCKIEWQNTCLEYNQEQLSAEIDKIIEQLKNAT